ncbi:MAG: GH25 family lysozyme, partial [Bacteroidaceae bacterium]
MQRTRTTRPTNNRKHRSSKGKTFLSRVPSYAWWIGGILFTAFYVFLFYYFFVGPFSFRWKAIYGESKFPKGYSIHGIDISHYQGTIDWEKLRNATIDESPIRFIIIKATEGTSLLDENFNENFYQAKENDFIRGAYHFFSPSIPAKKQAEYFLKQVHLEQGDFPPVLDIEHIGTQTAQDIKLSAL